MNYIQQIIDRNPQLVSRIKSYLWRAGGMAVGAGLASLSSNLGVLELSPFWATAVGLLIGELTKLANNWWKKTE